MFTQNVTGIIFFQTLLEVIVKNNAKTEKHFFNFFNSEIQITSTLKTDGN